MTVLKPLGLSLALAAGLATAPALAQSAYYGGGGSAATLYADPGFRGQSMNVTGPITHLDDYRFNDKVSSIRLTGGAWEVCVDPDFRGRCEIISHHVGELNDYRLNDNITSIRPASGRGYGGGHHDRGPGYGRDDNRGGHYGHGNRAPVVLFQDPDFRGDALPVNGAVRHLNAVRFNDTVSSIAVQDGAWEVCSDPDFRGRCEVLTGSVAETGYYRLNDNISSIRPAGRGYGHDRDRGRRW